MFDRFINYHNNVWYVQTATMYIAVLFYSLILLEFFLEMGFFSTPIGAMACVSVMLYYGLQYSHVLQGLDDSLEGLQDSLRENFPGYIKTIFSILASLILSMATVFEVTHVLLLYMYNSHYIIGFYILRCSLVVVMFRYMLQRILQNVIVMKMSELNYMPNLNAFSSLQFCVMIALFLFEGTVLSLVLCNVVSLVTMLFYFRHEHLPEIYSKIGAVLVSLYFFMYQPLGVVSWMILVNLALLIEKFTLENSTKSGHGYIYDLLTYCKDNIIECMNGSVVEIVVCFHAAIESLYPVLGLQHIISLSNVGLAFSFTCFYVAKALSLNQNPFSFWCSDNKINKKNNFDAIKDTSESFSVWSKLKNVGSKVFIGLLHGASDMHEFDHAMHHHHAHHSVSLANKALVFVSSVIASFLDLCCIGSRKVSQNVPDGLGLFNQISKPGCYSPRCAMGHSRIYEKNLRKNSATSLLKNIEKNSPEETFSKQPKPLDSILPGALKKNSRSLVSTYSHISSYSDGSVDDSEKVFYYCQPCNPI